MLTFSQKLGIDYCREATLSLVIGEPNEVRKTFAFSESGHSNDQKSVLATGSFRR